MEVEVGTKNLLFTRKLIRVEILIEAKYQQVPDYGYSNTHKEIMLRLLKGYIYIFRIYQIILVCSSLYCLPYTQYQRKKDHQKRVKKHACC